MHRLLDAIQQQERLRLQAVDGAAVRPGIAAIVSKPRYTSRPHPESSVSVPHTAAGTTVSQSGQPG